jgi:hypothetical protein
MAFAGNLTIVHGRERFDVNCSTLVPHFALTVVSGYAGDDCAADSDNYPNHGWVHGLHCGVVV